MKITSFLGILYEYIKNIFIDNTDDFWLVTVIKTLVLVIGIYISVILAVFALLLDVVGLLFGCNFDLIKWLWDFSWNIMIIEWYWLPGKWYGVIIGIASINIFINDH